MNGEWLHPFRLGRYELFLVERLISGLVLVAALGCSAAAQSSQSTWRPRLSAQVSSMPLYGGDATVGKYSGLGPSIRVGVTAPASGVTAEASYTSMPADDYSGKPRVQLAGILLGNWFGRETGAVSGFLGGGVGRLWIKAKDLSGCLPPSCFAEGGGNFHDATVTTLTGDIGAASPRLGGFAIRGDVRLHIPVDRPDGIGDSGKARLEFALGVMWLR